MSDHRFKEYDPDQLLLMPQDMRSWLPEDHLAWFVSDVVDRLDLTGMMDDNTVENTPPLSDLERALAALQKTFTAFSLS